MFQVAGFNEHIGTTQTSHSPELARAFAALSLGGRFHRPLPDRPAGCNASQRGRALAGVIEVQHLLRIMPSLLDQVPDPPKRRAGAPDAVCAS